MGTTMQSVKAGFYSNDYLYSILTYNISKKMFTYFSFNLPELFSSEVAGFP